VLVHHADMCIVLWWLCGHAGQAVLTLPFKSVDVSVALPPGLQLAATAAGHLDCRLQLLGAHMDWPAAGVTLL
jgi:hypothetical protein